MDRLSAVNEQYAATINTNRHHIDALKGQLEALQLRFQEKLDSQSRSGPISTLSLSLSRSVTQMAVLGAQQMARVHAQNQCRRQLQTD